MTLYSCSRNRLRQGLAQSLRRPNRESEVESKSEDLKRADEPIYHRTNLAERVIGSIPTQVAKLEGTCKGNTSVTALLPGRIGRFQGEGSARGRRLCAEALTPQLLAASAAPQWF